MLYKYVGIMNQKKYSVQIFHITAHKFTMVNKIDSLAKVFRNVFA